MGLKWSVEYNTGIDVIDDQHRRILDYIRPLAKVVIASSSGLPVQRLS